MAEVLHNAISRQRFGLRGRHWAAVAAGAALAAALAPVAAANPGDIDPSFHKQGKFSGGQAAEAVAVQADGKTLVLGSTTVARLKPKGRPDKPFGPGRDDGVAPTGIPTGYSGYGAADVAVQPDGGILVLGYQDNADGTAAFVVTRLTEAGELDPSFGAGGIASLPLDGSGGLDDFGPRPRMALQADGGIVVGGVLDGQSQLGRLTPSGLADSLLGGDGTAIVDLGPAVLLRDVAVDPAGMIVVAGSPKAEGNAASDFTVARLDATAAPDPAFSGDGRQTADLGGRETAAAVATQPDGKVVVGGTGATSCSNRGCDYRFAVARLDAAGELDPSFGSGGTATAAGPPGVDAEAAGLALQTDGKVVVAGGGNNFLLARFNGDGTLDAGFGSDGLTWTPFLGSYPAYGNALAIGPDGRIVVAGLVYLEKFYDELTIARYEVAEGPSDLDGDETTDRRDDCPRTFGSHRSGCPVIKRALRLKYDRRRDAISARAKVHQVSGEPLAGYRAATAALCAGRQGGRVTLYRRRPGADRKVDSARSAAGLRLSNPADGDYYARVGKALATAFAPDGPVELCAADRSKDMPVRG